MSAEPPFVLAIDQGTTSTRAILFDAMARPVALAQRELAQHYLNLGWVEHDPEDIWRDTLAVLRDAVARSGEGVEHIAAIGITNQRETVVVWDRLTGRPVYNAIVWQDRRTADLCARLKQDGAEPMVSAKTGLLLDPYFSGTKLAWILDNVAGTRARAEQGELAFGTVDSFLLWRLTGGKIHATDATNAGRTLLFDIVRQCWDEELLRMLDIPPSLLPTVQDSAGVFGHTEPDILGRSIPIAGVAGDQQAALFGQACFRRGMAKSTYGTGCFLLMNIGEQPVMSRTRLLTTPAYRLNGRTTYALEGSIFVAGAAIKWLRDRLRLVADAIETDAMAARVPDSHGVYMVPAFVGLGAPHWDPNARGLISGLTLDVSGDHLVRAALEAVAYQTLDLTDAMAADVGSGTEAIRIDGGMAVNNWLGQFLADMLQAPIERPSGVETTALGAAFLAGLAVGIWSDLETLERMWSLERRFEPRMPDATRARMVAGWRDAVRRALS